MAGDGPSERAEGDRRGPLLLAIAGFLLVWGFSTQHLGLRGGSVGYALVFVALGYCCAPLARREGWRPPRPIAGEAARTWLAVLVVVLAVAVAIAFGLRSFDAALTRRLGLSGLLGLSNWFSQSVPLPAQLVKPDPLLGLMITSLAAQLLVSWWAATRVLRRGQLTAAIFVVVGLGAQLLWFNRPSTAFASTLTYAIPFGLGAIAGLGPGWLPRLGWPAWVLALVGALATSLTLGPVGHLYRLVAFPLVAVVAALALASPVSRGSEVHLARLARLGLWPAILGFAVRSLLGPEQLHLRGTALLVAQLGITVAASLLGYLLVAALPKAPASTRPVLALAALPALVFTLVLVDVAGTRLVFPPGVLHAGASPVVAKAYPNPERHLTTLLVGGTDAFGLSFGVPPTAKRYGVLMYSDATSECGLVNGQQVVVSGERLRQDRGWRPGIGWVRCSTQLERWRADLRVLKPRVVVLAEGSSEVRTWIQGGAPRSILDADVAAAVRAGLADAVGVLGSRGAAVVVTTAPYYGVGVPFGRYGDPQNNPERVRAYNRIVRDVAKATGASVYDLNRPTCPQGRFQIRAHGIVMRGTDGIVLSPAGGRYVQPGLLAKVKEVAP